MLSLLLCTHKHKCILVPLKTMIKSFKGAKSGPSMLQLQETDFQICAILQFVGMIFIFDSIENLVTSKERVPQTSVGTGSGFWTHLPTNPLKISLFMLLRTVFLLQLKNSKSQNPLYLLLVSIVAH